MVGKRIGKYRLVRQIGEGGMGVVYEAVREDIAARAALKILRPELAVNPELAGRFFNELRRPATRRSVARSHGVGTT